MQAVITFIVSAITALLSAAGYSVIATPTVLPTVAAISAAENAYFAANGVYFQVLPGDQPAPYEIGTVAANLGKDVPPSIEVDIYSGPDGQGYQVVDDSTTTDYSVGFGGEASTSLRSYQNAVPVSIKSGTSSGTSI